MIAHLRVFDDDSSLKACSRISRTRKISPNWILIRSCSISSPSLLHRRLHRELQLSPPSPRQFGYSVRINRPISSQPCLRKSRKCLTRRRNYGVMRRSNQRRSHSPSAVRRHSFPLSNHECILLTESIMIHHSLNRRPAQQTIPRHVPPTHLRRTPIRVIDRTELRARQDRGCCFSRARALVGDAGVIAARSSVSAVDVGDDLVEGRVVKAGEGGYRRKEGRGRWITRDVYSISKSQAYRRCNCVVTAAYNSSLSVYVPLISLCR